MVLLLNVGANLKEIKIAFYSLVIKIKYNRIKIIIINNKELKTQENDDSLKYLFNKEKNALSEYGNGNGIQAKGYEVLVLLIYIIYNFL